MAASIAKHIVEAGVYINNWANRNEWIRLPDGSEVPAYLSCRRLISIPASKILIKQALVDIAKKEFSGSATSVIGLATAGIVWGDAVADGLSLPFGYVRGEKKVYGVGRLVECNPPSNTKAVLVDDVLLTGTSFLVAKEALLSERDIKTVGAITVASLYPNSPTAFEESLNAPVVTLLNYDELCDAALNSGLFSNAQYQQMMEYYRNPQEHVFEDLSNAG